MDVWRVVRASPSNNGLPSQNDEENGRSSYIIYRSQSNGEPRRDDVVYIVIREGGVTSRNYDCKARKRGKAESAQQSNNHIKGLGTITRAYNWTLCHFERHVLRKQTCRRERTGRKVINWWWIDYHVVGKSLCLWNFRNAPPANARERSQELHASLSHHNKEALFLERRGISHELPDLELYTDDN